jgi:hypothetical protein
LIRRQSFFRRTTIEKLAAVLGKRIEWRITDAPAAKQPAS